MVFMEHELDCDSIVKNLLINEMGILLIQSTIDGMFKILEERTDYHDKIGIFGNKTHISYYLYPIHYKNCNEPDRTLLNCRVEAISNIFFRWNKLGYNKSKAKSPYGSKLFNEYLKNIGYYQADYLLLGVSD